MDAERKSAIEVLYKEISEIERRMREIEPQIVEIKCVASALQRALDRKRKEIETIWGGGPVPSLREPQTELDDFVQVSPDYENLVQTQPEKHH